MSAKTIVYLRADGSKEIGLGHIHRSLALIDMLRPWFEAKFIIRSPLPGIRSLIHKNDCEIIELIEGNEEAELDSLSVLLTNEDIVVLDGYDFTDNYQKRIKQFGAGLVCIDDDHQRHFVADIVINPAGGVGAGAYSLEPYTQLFTGPEFALIKKPFRKSKVIRNTPPHALLICMGGSDPSNHTARLLKACLSYPFDEYFVVVGEGYNYIETLNSKVANEDKRVRILVNISPESMASIMTTCGTAICSASGVAYEYLSVGGELYITQTATNQRALFDFLIRESLAFRFEDFRADSDRIRISDIKQQAIFDGNIDKRILKIFSELDFSINVRTRTATEADLSKTFEWANDPELRVQSYNSNPISSEDHAEWFRERLFDPSTYIYIFEYKGIPIGQVRFSISTEAAISYSIDIKYRGRGWGALVVKKAIEIFQDSSNTNCKIVGYVKFANDSSNRIFKKLRFSQVITEKYPDSYRYEYLLS